MPYNLSSIVTCAKPIINRSTNRPGIEFKLAMGVISIVVTDDTNVERIMTRRPPYFSAHHPPRILIDMKIIFKLKIRF